MLLTAFGVVGVALSLLGSPDGAAAVATGMLGVAAMGTQNAIGRLALPHLAATTMMTVNITQGVIDAVDLVRGAAESGARSRLHRIIFAVIAFALGALAGAFSVTAQSFYCFALPTLILLGLIGLSSSRPGGDAT